MSVFMYFSGFESFAPLERWCDFAKFWCGKKKLVAVLSEDEYMQQMKKKDIYWTKILEAYLNFPYFSYRILE